MAWVPRARGRGKGAWRTERKVSNFIVWKRALRRAGTEAETPVRLWCSEPVKVTAAQTRGLVGEKDGLGYAVGRVNRTWGGELDEWSEGEEV